MSNVKCIYCGADIPETSDNCPKCQAPSHYQTHGKSAARQKNFIRNFIILVIFIIFMILWLPR